MTTSILECTSDDFITLARERGVAREEALRLYREAYRAGRIECDWAAITCSPITRATEEHGTIKFIQRGDDGLETESVILPMRHRSGETTNTLCLSSQVGCAMGCTFCETAQMGLMKNLSAGEIVGQWFAARHHFSIRIRNIVFMGMGEPMDNLDAVFESIEILTDRDGAAIAPANICVSTVGRISGIRRLIEFASRDGFRKLKLAVSVNAPNDEIRSQIMPVNRAEPMAELMDAMCWWAERCSPVLVEYVLIPGVNDAIAHADQLCEYLRPLGERCKVNVIPYNPRRDSPWPATAEDDVARFIARIATNGVFVKRRRTLGRAVMAACGQLGNEYIRRRRVLAGGTGILPVRQD